MQQTNIEFQQEDITPTPIKPHNKYGNIILLYQTSTLTLSIGPHYYLFIPTFIGFIAAAVFLTIFVNQIFTNLIFRSINVLFSIIQIASYLVVALSNPGIVFGDEDSRIFKNEEERSMALCNKCGARRSKKVRHCSYCNVCIKGYDHHCPWISKCIGADNFQYFNFFVGITPLYIMYYIVVVCICLTG